MNLKSVSESYRTNGYVSAIRVLSEAEALDHRARYEAAEAERGNLHYKAKLHTVMTSPLAIATDPRVLDIVEALIGPDVLLYDVTYIVKEPGSASHVSWHQDLTYWGLSDDAQVSMWLAHSPATELSGCMRMIPGSHSGGMVHHVTTEDSSNVLFQGQTVAGIDEQMAVTCPLRPGEASFHHGWTLHASMPNRSDDRRIGLNVQYLAPHVRQTKHDLDSSLLVRGEDRFRHFRNDVPAEGDFLPDAMARWMELDRLHVETQGTA